MFRWARWISLALTLVFALSPPAARAAAGPDETEVRERTAGDDGPEESSRQNEFFRRIAGGEMDAARMRQMWRDAMASPFEAAATAAVNNWQLVGPIYSTNTGGGQMTGRVRDIDALNQRVLAASGGLWRFNFGAVPMSDSVPASWFGSFATSPSDPNTILLGTGEYGKGIGTGLYKTTDGGATWSSIFITPEPGYFMRVRYSPDGSVVHAATDQGYFRSADGGATWTRTMQGVVTDVTMTVGDPNRLFATVLGSGIWRSLDAGMTWAQLTTGGIPTSGTPNGAVAAIHLYPSDVVWIYVAFESTIYRSVDGGVNWTNISPPYNPGTSGYGPTISVCPNDGNTVLYGNVSYNRTTDGGAHWTKITSSNLHADYHVFSWDSNGTGVWAGNDGGWFHSTDLGLTWSSSANVMPITQFYNIDCEKTETGYMVGGAQDNNVLYTPTEALYWTDPIVGNSTEGDGYGVCIDEYNPSHMWAVSGVSNLGLSYPRSRTTDGGQTWQVVDNGIATNNYTGGELRSDNAFPVDLVTSSGPFVYESTDGTNWSLANPGGFPANVQSLTESQRVSPSAVLYATLSGSTSGQRLYVREGGIWSERSSGLPSGNVVKVVPHPWAASANEAWALMNNSATQKVFHTTDRGVTWTDVTGDLPISAIVTDLVTNPRSTGELYLGTLTGCYRSRNGGANWDHWSNGMPLAIVTEMTYIDLTSTTGQFFVVAGTYGRSVWKRDASGDDPLPVITVSNPMCDETNGSTSVWFQLRLSSPSSYAVTVDYSTADSTATLADNDYTSKSGTAVFSPGQTTTWAIVQVNGDTQIEPDEYFKLNLSNPVHALLGGGPGVCTLEDDDAHLLVSLQMPVTDGAVSAVATSGGTIYIGGSFSRAGTATGCAVPLDPGSGQPVWLPEVDGLVTAMVSDGAGGWFIGGLFDHVAGHPRVNLAHLNSNHTLAAWNPGANDLVFGLALKSGVLYVAGRFTTIAGEAHSYLAAVDANSGFTLNWNPNPGDQVVTLALNGNTLYAGGDFTSIGGQARNHIAALNTGTALATSWNPGADAAVGTLVLSGPSLYVGGSFAHIGGQPRNYVASLDTTAGNATAWDPHANLYVNALAVGPATVYAGGSFDSIGGQPRSGLAAIDRSTGAVTAWAPNPDAGANALALAGSTLYAGGAFSNIGGQARHCLAAVDATSGLVTSWNPDPNNVVTALAADGSTVLAGGSFSSLAAQPRASLAAIDAATGALLPWNPGANGSVNSLACGGGVIYAGGSFTAAGGQTRNRIAAIDSVSGAATSWDANANGTVRTLMLAGGKLYAGGSFTGIGGQTRNRVAALSLSNGLATSWNPNSNGTVYSLATDGTYIYPGGAYTSIGGQARSALAQLNSTGGAASPTWAPNPNGTVKALAVTGTSMFVGGSFTQIATVGRTRIALLDISAGTIANWNPSPNGEVDALAVSGSSIYAAGAFTTFGGLARGHVALARPTNNSVSPWLANSDDNVTALALSGTTVYVGGSFASMDGLPQTHFATLLPQAPAGAPSPDTPFESSLSLAPNPTRGRVEIQYVLHVAARVSLGVFDVQGRRVAEIVDGTQPAGPHRVDWEVPGGGSGAGRALANGIYFTRIEVGGKCETRRFVVVR